MVKKILIVYIVKVLSLQHFGCDAHHTPPYPTIPHHTDKRSCKAHIYYGIGQVHLFHNYSILFIQYKSLHPLKWKYKWSHQFPQHLGHRSNEFRKQNQVFPNILFLEDLESLEQIVSSTLVKK